MPVGCTLKPAASPAAITASGDQRRGKIDIGDRLAQQRIAHRPPATRASPPAPAIAAKTRLQRRLASSHARVAQGREALSWRRVHAVVEIADHAGGRAPDIALCQGMA